MNVATFCSLLPILESFFLVPFEAHLAVVVMVTELELSSRTAKTGRLAKEVNALGLINRQSTSPIAIIHCHAEQSIWILELSSLECPREYFFVGFRRRSSAESTSSSLAALHLVMYIATTADSIAAANVITL